MAKTPETETATNWLNGLTPEPLPEGFVTRSARKPKYSEDEINTATRYLESAYQHGEWRALNCSSADDAKHLTLLFRYTADQVGAGLGIYTKDDDPNRVIFRVKDRRTVTRTQSDDPKPRKPRETAGRAGTPEYRNAYNAYIEQLTAWQERQV